MSKEMRFAPHLRAFTLILFVVFALMFLALPRGAKAIDVISIEPADWSCISFFAYVNAVVTFTGGGEPDPNNEVFGYRVTDGDGDILANAGFSHSWTPGTEPPPTTFTFFLNALPTQNPVTIEIIDWDINGVPTGASWSVQTISPCVSDTPTESPTPTPTATSTPTNTPPLTFNVISMEPSIWNCGFPIVNVDVVFTGGGETAPNEEVFGYRVIDGDGDILANEITSHSWTPGTEPPPTTFPFFLNAQPTQNPVTIEIIDVDVNHVPTGTTWSIQTDSPCVPTATPTATSTPTNTPTATFTNTPTPTFTSTPTQTSPSVTPLSVCWVKHWNGTGSTEWRISNPNPVPIISNPDTKVRYNWSVFNQLNAQGSVIQSAQGWDNANPNPVNTAYTQSIRLEWYLVTNGTPSAILGTVIANANAGGRC
jgi:hypothetical protein